MIEQYLPAVLSAVFAGGGAYAAVRVEIRHLWRKIAEIERELLRLRNRVPT